MPIDIRMPALSPTMTEGKLARWLVKVGDTVASGDIMAEIETDKATMEFEAVDEGTIAAISVAEGSEGVKVGTVIATLSADGEPSGSAVAVPQPAVPPSAPPAKAAETPETSGLLVSPQARRLAAERGIDLSAVVGTGPGGRIVRADVEGAPAGIPAQPQVAVAAAAAAPDSPPAGRVIATPLARRLAAGRGIDLAAVAGSGPGGRIVRADVEGAPAGASLPSAADRPPAASAPAASAPAGGTPAENVNDFGIPYQAQKLNNVRKGIARRLTEAKQSIPHIYLTLDIRLDALLDLRTGLNKALEKDGIKISVNDLVIKALARSLLQVPTCNVSFAGDELRRFSRADISVAVAAPSGLITPIIVDAGARSVSQIATEMKALADKARQGKLQPHEYQGGTASLSNLGMFGIRNFDAVINPPQGMILAVGAGEQRPYAENGQLIVATVMSATGSFDHRAIDGADGAQLMQAIRDNIENPLGLVA